MLRTFFAVKIAPSPDLRRLHGILSALGDRFRPAALDNLHVTLKFLGDTEPSRVSQICALVKPIIEQQPAVHVQLKGLGAFPHSRRPAVVWVGLSGADGLCRIASDLDRELAPLGFAPEGRPFQPHLTLLRVKSRPPESLFALLADEARADYGLAAVDEVEFIQSEPGKTGSRYTTLATFALAAAR